MKRFNKFIGKIAYWILPMGVNVMLSRRYEHYKLSKLSREERIILQANQKFFSLHSGERCFVLATGPSIKYQNLVSLQNEWCIGVSDFYKHQDYGIIKPSYYCLTPLHPPFSAKDGLRRFDELDAKSHGDETFIFGLRDRELFKQSSLAKKTNKVNFLNIRPIGGMPNEIDLTKNFPSISSVSIMALLVAVYMGFSEIYLLGCDHNNIWTWDGKSNQKVLEHFYDGTPSIGYEQKVFDIDRAMQAHLKVREQYKWIKNIAVQKNIKIYNASPGSYLDIFPKVNVEDVVSTSWN